LLPNFLAARPRPVSPYYPALSEVMQINFHQALSGIITAAEGITNIEQEMKQYYEDE
jgi:multiple sugar transport system substrate-binding protein